MGGVRMSYVPWSPVLPILNIAPALFFRLDPDSQPSFLYSDLILYVQGYQSQLMSSKLMYRKQESKGK